jgi:hypothetical protein
VGVEHVRPLAAYHPSKPKGGPQPAGGTERSHRHAGRFEARSQGSRTLEADDDVPKPARVTTRGESEEELFQAAYVQGEDELQDLKWRLVRDHARGAFWCPAGQRPRLSALRILPLV